MAIRATVGTVTADFVSWRANAQWTGWHLRVGDDAKTLCGLQPEGRVSYYQRGQPPEVCEQCREALKRQVTHNASEVV